MTQSAEQARYSNLETWFSAIMDSPVEAREAMLRELEETDAGLAREARELVRVHEGRVPVLDDGVVPSVEVKGLARSLVDTTIEGWRISRHIGRGGWADVYEARQRVPERACALKVLRWPWLCTARTLQRFRDEADLLARVEHPGIARVYGAGVANVAGTDLPYLALELVPDAAPITKYAIERGLSLRERLELFVLVCDAVHSAHRRGVLHRDLKPSNVLVGSDGRARVIDFGIAYAMDQAGAGMTWTGEIMGTVGYMSPERLTTGAGGARNDGAAEEEGAGMKAGNEPPDVRWDVYSLGVILYELVTGKSPYALPGNVAGAVAVVQRGEPVPPREAERSLPTDVCTIIETAMERDAGRRYQSVAELGGDVGRYLDDRPIAARPTPWGRRVRLAARRHPARAAVIVCTVIGTVAVVGTGLRGWEATRQELRATEMSLNVLDDAMSVARSRRQGDQVRISDLIERLEEPLKEDEGLSPRVAARLHEMLGRTYEDLADYEAAQGHYQMGLGAARSVWGEDDSLVVRLKVELAGSMYDRGDALGAARTLEELLEHSGRLEPAVLAKVKNDLAVAYMKGEQWREAERVGLEAYALRVAALGEHDPASVQSLVNLGANAMRLGELETARERLTIGLERAKPLGREGARGRFHAEAYLALTLARLGERRESAAMGERAMEGVVQLVGREHPTYIKLGLITAEAALERGDTAQAAAMATDVLDRADRVLGAGHPDAAAVRARAGELRAQARKGRGERGE